MIDALEPFWGGFSGIVIGIGLSAACGFRIILPFFGLSVAALTGHITLAPELMDRDVAGPDRFCHGGGAGDRGLLHSVDG